ncbi:C-3 sterol dehydrogenase/C-4 decarboxylase-like protein [Lepidopterella palustris CBS 459.81]|uniref:C-3 sterol dehydrogenase/C-4 decarboxylase-like protein n=1 Tax=Lepidopterella palustris CBS 459.81 TaxID=1314670 RepID=A0A8E2EHZ9_9PEZI|nr:C-3 sterol dehydrogenase/C-4 decarboxylase-like protein [Lepidopterella palustris CBS 459.81]
MEVHRILVTGGTGFLGSAIVNALVKQEHYDITVLDIKPPSTNTPSRPNVKYVQANVLNLSDTQKIFKQAKPTIVIHTVAVSPIGSDRYSQRRRASVFGLNVNGTRNMLDAAKECGVRAFVYTSSCAVVTDDVDRDYPNMDESTPTGNATLVYGQSKAAAEKLVLQANTPHFLTCALRPSIIFGLGDTQTLPTIHACISKHETPYILGSGLNLFDFVYVTNVADAHLLAVSNLLTTRTAAGEAFFVSNGQPVPFRDFCVAIWAEFGHVPPWEARIPRAVAWALGGVAEWVTWLTGSQATLSRGSVKDACGVRYANLEKARRVLGYEPTVGLAEGVKIACQHYKRQIEQLS